ncbi:DUF2730 family protein [Shewanella algae]|uniref:DUF2730 family protein n=1 Tax=Shewanella algae TaxID=38313 RepID=UPI0031F4AF12
MLAELKSWWPMLWALVLTLAQIVLMLLSKTYARREEMEGLSREVKALEHRVDNLPTHGEMNLLKLELAETRGEIKELRAALQPVNHLAQLLLENQLKEKE